MRAVEDGEEDGVGKGAEEVRDFEVVILTDLEDCAVAER